MAEAIIRGLINTKKASPKHIFAFNRSNQNRLSELHRNYGIQAVLDSGDKERILQDADIVVLAMKPKDAAMAMKDIAPLLVKQPLLISVIAGLTIHKLERMAGPSIPIVRTMPNTSSTIGLGATGISFSDTVSPEQQLLAEDIFNSIGIVRIVKEEHLDIVTGLSGSGPAYVYLMIEKMIEAGVEGGLAEDAAAELAVQTVLGAAQMLNHTKESPASLRIKVTSPGGTTQAALEVLDKEGFSTSLKKAILRAAERARELGQQT